MSSKTYVLDTCVLLADPHSPLRCDEHDVVLPLVVIEELDRHKSRMDEVGSPLFGHVTLDRTIRSPLAEYAAAVL